MGIHRIGSRSMHENTLRTIQARQGELADQVHKASSGKRVLRAGDDPLAAATAERARARLGHDAATQRALLAQRASMGEIESTLGQAHGAMQQVRDLLLGAGNAAMDKEARDALLSGMQRMHEELVTCANRKDSNGLPLFRGLGSSGQPLQGQHWAGLGGQGGSGEDAIPSSVDGRAVWMQVPTGNGSFVVRLGGGDSADGADSAGFWTDAGSISDPRAASAAPLPLDVVFSTNAQGQLQYSADGGQTHSAWVPGQALDIHGMRIDIHGTPRAGDSLRLEPSGRDSIFGVLERTMTAIDSAEGGGSRLAHTIARALAEMDTGMQQVQAARAFAGDLLRRAEHIEDRIGQRQVQHEALRSQAEDMDMLRALADVEMQKTTLQAALQSYASIQKLSLFDFLHG